MAKNLILALSMFLIIGLSSFKKDKHKPESKLDLYATITGRSIVDGRVRLGVIATIQNNSKTTLSFMNMTCDYQSRFCTDNVKYDLVYTLSCDGNFPMIYNLKPGTKHDYTLVVYVQGGYLPGAYNFQLYSVFNYFNYYFNEKSYFRLGFYWFIPEYPKEVMLSPWESNGTIWSNALWY